MLRIAHINKKPKKDYQVIWERYKEKQIRKFMKQTTTNLLGSGCDAPFNLDNSYHQKIKQ